MTEGWDTYYRWEWFRREQWLDRYRARVSASRHAPAFARLLRERGGALALDCSCGFGAKTFALKKLGVDIYGSDACEFAVEKARELATSGSAGIEYFVSSWAELPERTPLRFDGVLNDTLSWIANEGEFREAIGGIRDVLASEGALVFFGAQQGDPPGRGEELLRAKYESLPKFAIDWSHEEGDMKCTCVVARVLQEEPVDTHRLYVIEDQSGMRLETSTLSEPSHWDWPLLERLFAEAGYSALTTERINLDYGREPVAVNVAVR